jgi:hypothetical protein
LKIKILIDWLNLIFQNLFYWLKVVRKDGELLDSVAFDGGGISKSVEWQGGGEFIYFELDKYNQKYIDKLNAIKQGHGTAKTIEQLYNIFDIIHLLNANVLPSHFMGNGTGCATA